MLLLLGAIWGASFLFIRVAVPSLGPLLLMDARVFLAAGTLLLYAVLFRQIPNLLARWREFLMLGALNAAIPFTLIAFSQLTLTASLAAIINSTTPLFTALVAAVWIDEPLTLRKAAGALLGIGGVMLLVGGSPLQLNTALILAVVVAASAAHRAEAFDACREAIERIKATVPIWKKEWYCEQDGTLSSSWVSIGACEQEE